MDWRYETVKRGKSLGKRIINLKWHTFNSSGKFEETNELDIKKPTFLQDRQEKRNEEELLETIFPFIAYFTAPTPEDAEDVISKVYMEQQIAADRFMSILGVSPNNPDLALNRRLKNSEIFFEQFKIMSEEVEKACIKLTKDGSK